MNKSLLLLLLSHLVINIGKIECKNLSKRYFITINMAKGVGRPVNIRQNLRNIQNALCNSPARFDVSNPVKCFLRFKVVGEPRVIVVLDVHDSAELEHRLLLLTSSTPLQYRSEPLVEYDEFARFLGVDEHLANLNGNTLENIPEVLWCEFNINFGDKNASEALAIWKQEAEVVFQTRSSGIPLEIFKTLGERTVHILIEIDASSFDQILFGTPFGMEIASTLKTTCRTLTSFKSVIGSYI